MLTSGASLFPFSDCWTLTLGLEHMWARGTLSLLWHWLYSLGYLPKKIPGTTETSEVSFRKRQIPSLLCLLMTNSDMHQVEKIYSICIVKYIQDMNIHEVVYITHITKCIMYTYHTSIIIRIK